MQACRASRQLQQNTCTHLVERRPECTQTPAARPGHGLYLHSAMEQGAPRRVNRDQWEPQVAHGAQPGCVCSPGVCVAQGPCVQQGRDGARLPSGSMRDLCFQSDPFSWHSRL